MTEYTCLIGIVGCVLLYILGQPVPRPYSTKNRLLARNDTDYDSGAERDAAIRERVSSIERVARRGIWRW